MSYTLAAAAGQLRVDHELIRRELEDIQALLHDATQRNAAGRLWWFAVALVVACCGGVT